jgi:ATP-dependent helicase/DNAse subunit B
MAPVNVYQAGAWYEFWETKQQWLGREAFVVIIPEHENKNDLTKAFGDADLRGVLTIPDLIERYARIFGKKGLITLHGLETILSAIITESAAPFLKIAKYRQGYVKALTDFIYNFRQNSATDLRTALAHFKTETRFTLKEKDLIKIYAEYEARLENYGFDFKSGLEALVRSTSAATIRQQLSLDQDERVIFYGFNFITPLEEEFLFSMFKSAAKVTWLACAAPAAAEQAVRIENSITALLKRAEDLVVERSITPPNSANFLIDLANGVFHSGLRQTNPDLGTQLTLSKENNRFSEVVAVARRIKRLTANGVALTTIRVIAPLYDTYCSLIAELFPDYGIAFRLEDGVPLLQLPLAAVVYHLVIQSVQANPYQLREKIFSSPYTQFKMPLKPGVLVKYQEYAGVALLTEDQLVRNLRPDFQYQLDFNYLRNLRTKAYRKIKAAPETPQLEIVRQYLESLEWPDGQAKQSCLLRCLIQFYLLGQAEKQLYVWQAQMSGAEFTKAVRELFRRFNLEANLQIGDSSNPNSSEQRVQDRDLAVFKQIEAVLDGLEVLSPAPAGKISFGELTRIFVRRMGEARFHWEADGGVMVQPADRGQYYKWDHTFIVGLVDGEYPGADAFNFLQPQREGLGLGSVYTSVDHARNHFYHQIRSTVRTIHFSLPLSHNGRRLAPSPFIREVEKYLASTGATSSEVNIFEPIYGRREQLLSIGKKVDDHYQEVVPLLTTIKNSDVALFDQVTQILRFDGMAMNATAFSEFDGIFSADAATLELLKRAVRKITFTPEVLERYAACPLRFFFDDILQLKIMPDFHPDLSEAGLLIHSVLQEYTKQACATGEVPEEAAGLLKDYVGARLREQFQENADAFQMRYTRQFLAGLDANSKGRPGLFSAFLTYEKEAPDLLRPYLANLRGMLTVGDELTLQVTVDRVDLTKAGDYFLLYSYTTGDTGNPGKIFQGLRFDLPLAILLFANYTAANGLTIPIAGAGMYLVKNSKLVKRGGYFALKRIIAARRNNLSELRPVFSGQREGLLEEEDFAMALEKVVDQVLRLYRLINQGVFHLPLCSEADQTCFNCPFGRICRKDQLRLEKLRCHLGEREDVNLVGKIF